MHAHMGKGNKSIHNKTRKYTQLIYQFPGGEMKRILLFFFVLASTFSGSLYAQPDPDFSGTWVLDMAKSDLGTSNSAIKQGQMHKILLILTQTTNQLTIKRSTGDTAIYNLDGSESVNSLPNGSQATTFMKWDGNTLVAKTTSNLGGQTVEMSDVRSLDSSGQIMTVHLTRKTPRGEMKQTLIYSKQE